MTGFAPVYSKRFFERGGVTGTGTIPVPSNKVWVVKDINIVTAAQPSSPYCLIRGGLGAAIALAVQGSATVPMNFQWQGMVVVYQGESLSWFVSAATFDVSINGYELTA